MHLFFSPIGKLTLYLDPGTGSMVIQVVLAALLSVGVLVRVFWNKISSWFMNRQTGSDCGSHRLLYQVCFLRSSSYGGFPHRSFLHRSAAGWYTYYHPGPYKRRSGSQSPVDEITQHGLGNIKISNYTVLHRAYGNNIARCPAYHLLGFITHRQHPAIITLYSNHRRFPHNNAFAF